MELLFSLTCFEYNFCAIDQTAPTMKEEMLKLVRAHCQIIQCKLKSALSCPGNKSNEFDFLN